MSLMQRAPLIYWPALYRQRRLTLELVKRDIAGRYRGSALGAIWSLVNPLILLCMYSFVFGVIFKSKWSASQSGGLLQFAVVMFAGMLIHGLFAEVAQRAPELILNNANYVKKIIFPLEILPWVTVLTSLFHFAVASLVLLAGIWFMRGDIPPTIALAPLVILAFLPFVTGIGWILASLGVYFRDLKQIVGVVVALSQFLAPVFYPLSNVPPKLRVVIEANPLTLIIIQFRAVAIDGAWPDWLALTRYASIGIIFATFALWWFKRTSKGFADVV